MLILLKVLIFLLLSSGALLQKSGSNPFNINFRQNDYKLKFERGDVVSYNKNYVKTLNARTFKYNRTCAAVNLTIAFEVDVGNDLEVVVQAYKFASNEYRQFPMRFQFNLCDGFAKNSFGMATAVRCGNVVNCPFKKANTYHVCNFTPDETQFPPLIPNGNFMVELQVLYFGNEAGLLRAYFEIFRPIVRK